MRLINPGVGEITDRLTILALKILYAGQADKPVDHFTTERAALLTQIRTKDLNGAWFEQVLSLAAVNAALWQAEDELRANRVVASEEKSGEPFSWPAVGRIAFRIQELNDQRASLVEMINKLAGDHKGAEKL